MTIIFNLLVLQLDDGAPSALCKWKWPVSIGRGVFGDHGVPGSSGCGGVGLLVGLAAHVEGDAGVVGWSQ